MITTSVKQVAAGESLLVTDRDKPVAVFQPLRGRLKDRRLEGLIAAGLVAPPRAPLDVKGLLREKRGQSKRSLTGAIDEDREGR
jgi:antitoxin (DNA-binding transcriptional repressor) of toxin-antitoxin stability system